MRLPLPHTYMTMKFEWKVDTVYTEYTERSSSRKKSRSCPLRKPAYDEAFIRQTVTTYKGKRQTVAEVARELKINDIKESANNRDCSIKLHSFKIWFN